MMEEKDQKQLVVDGEAQRELIIDERHQKILNILADRRFASVNYLSSELFVSKPTVRRDLTYLTQKGLINRSYGGAMVKALHNVPVEFRLGVKNKEKAALSKAAAALIKDTDIIFLDASTTTLPITSCLKDKKDLTVVTNSMQVLNALRNTAVTVYCIGGKMVQNSFAFVGNISQNILKQFQIDIAFFSSYSVSKDGVISDYSEVETDTRKAALMQARTKVFMGDSQKIGRSSAFVVADTNDLDYFITDYQKPLNFANKKLSVIIV